MILIINEINRRDKRKRLGILEALQTHHVIDYDQGCSCYNFYRIQAVSYSYDFGDENSPIINIDMRCRQAQRGG